MVSHVPVFLTPLSFGVNLHGCCSLTPLSHKSDTILNFDKADLNEPIRDASHPTVTSLPRPSRMFPSPAQCKEAVSRMFLSLSRALWPGAFVTQQLFV